MGLAELLKRVEALQTRVESKESESEEKYEKLVDELEELRDSVMDALEKERQAEQAHYIVATVQRMILNPRDFCHEQIRSLEVNIREYCREWGDY